MSEERREALEAAMAEVEAKQEPVVDPAEPAKVDPPAEPVEEPTDGRARDDQGRFAAKTDPVEPAKVDEPVKTDPVVEKPARKLPSTWRASLDPKFQTLDDEVVAEIERREADAFKGIEQYRSKAQRADAFERAIQPFMATIQSQGVPPEQAIQGLLTVDHRLRYGTPQDKMQTFANLAQSYGVDLSQLAQGMPAVDPQMQQMEQRYAQLYNQLQAQQQAQQQRDNQMLMTELSSFAKSNKYFDHVREDMAALLQAGRASSLDEAYDRAVWANPETRKALQAEQSAGLEASKRDQAQRAANAAKTAGVSIAGAPVQGANTPNPQDRRAMLEAAASRRV